MNASPTQSSDRPLHIVGLVTARGGSLGIPGKNIKPLAGKAMIGWTIEAAMNSPSLSRVIVSTDSDEIASVCRAYGVEVPFARPPELALSTTTHIEVVTHALEWLQAQGAEPDYVMLLQPTAPLRIAADIENAIDIVRKTGAQNVVSVAECEPHPWLALKQRTEDGSLEMAYANACDDLRRQAMPPMWFLNGAIYLNSRASLLRERTFFPPGSMPYRMPAERSLDVDTPLDFFLAEQILHHRHAHI